MHSNAYFMKMIICIALLYFMVFGAIGSENTSLNSSNTSNNWHYVHIYNPVEKESHIENMSYVQFTQGYSSIDGMRDYSLTRIPGRSSNNYMGSMA